MLNEEQIKRQRRKPEAYFQQLACTCGSRVFTAEALPVARGERGSEDEGNPNVNAHVIGVVCAVCKKTIFYNGC